MNKAIEITKRFTEIIWNLNNDKESPLNTSLQDVRLYVYFLSISDQNKLEIDVSRKSFYKEAFTYIDRNTKKRKYLMNETRFNKMINSPSSVWTYNPQTDIIHINLNIAYDVFYRNYFKKGKEDANYNPLPFKKIKAEEWEIMKASSENLMKLYFLIQYHRTHSPQTFFKTNLDNIRARCLIKLSNDRILKQRLIVILNFLKENNVIFDYVFKKKDLTIQIHKQREKPEIKTILHIHTNEKKPKTNAKKTNNIQQPAPIIPIPNQPKSQRQIDIENANKKLYNL